LNLQLLAEDFDPPQTPRERKGFDRVLGLTDECRRLLELSNDFLRFARLDELRLVRVGLDAVVSRMVDFLAPTARMQNVEVTWQAEPDVPPVSLDVEMFEKALLNLMLNAEDAMPDGGALTLRVRAEPGWVILDVIDSGAGIPDDMLPKLFRPFVTTKPEGNGLGLATTKKIVHAHGGEIAVQSAVGRGTMFTVRLPPG